MKLPAIFAAVILLAGCLGPKEPGEKAPDDKTVGDGPSLLDLPRHAEFGNCTYQSVGYDWPTAIAPGEVPPGWEPELGIYTTYVMRFMDCGRVAWGPFERPLTMLLETSNLGGDLNQEKCQVGSIVDDLILHSMWLDDAEVAAYLHENYGIPTIHADVGFADTTVGETFHRTWSFSVDGSAPSTVIFPEPVGTEATNDSEFRLVWWNGTVLGFLDMPTRSDYVLHPGAYPTVASFEPPALLAETGVQKSVHVGNWWDEMHAASEILLWADPGCTEPL